MATLNQMVESEQNDITSCVEGQAPQLPQAPQSNILSSLAGIFSVDTGEGEIEEYSSHPLNFNGKKWLSRIVRGISGYVGNTRKAWIDIVLGLLEMRMEGKTAWQQKPN